MSGSYIISRIATLLAKKAGFDEAILLDYKGNVAEGAAENIFVVKNGRLFTSPIESILGGITRRTIMEIAKDFGIECYEKFFKKDFLLKADEAFFTGTATEITPIIQINGKKIGDGKPGKMTLMLKKIYLDVVRGKIAKYKKWLTYVY